jgi:uncharacterized membrane protein YbhN (UPF0104 family)
MKTLRTVIGSSVTRWVFLAIALAGLAWAVIKNWSSLMAALSVLPAWAAMTSVLLAVCYVFFTMWSWRVILADLGTPLDWNVSTQLFGISQIGKYIPGGVWNIVAAAQIGRDHDIPARRSVTAMTVAVLISLLSGVGIGAVTLMTTAQAIQIPSWAILLVLAALLVMLTPPVLNRLIAFGFALLKRPGLEQPLTFRGLGLSTLLASAAWVLAGMQIWVLGIGFGMKPDAPGLLLSVGAYALAWVVGFLVVFVPAGTGVRESVLGLFFAGVLSTGAVLAVVLVSRIAMTLADLLFAGAGALLSAHAKRRGRSDEKQP